MIILQKSGPKGTKDLTGHIWQKGLKVFSDICLLAIEIISICDRICFNIFFIQQNTLEF